MEKLRQWYFNNYTEITWFLIGFLVADGIAALGNGRYVNALISFSIAGINYFISRR
jgi:hypothetical protein